MNNLDQLLKTTESEMQKAIHSWMEHTDRIRTGRANPKILERVMVNYYGTPTPIFQTAQITIPEPHLILVKPYDRTQITEIVGGINKADLGVNPIADAEVIRIPLPPLTEEIRKNLVKKMWKELETFKVRIRNERREAIDKIKKNQELSEDQIKGWEKDIQNLTDKYTKILDEKTKLKEKEIMTI